MTRAQQALAAKWHPLATRLVANYHRKFGDLDADDLRSAGHEALAVAAQHYDPSKLKPDGRPYSFGSYLGTVMQRHLATEACRQRARGMAKLGNALRNHRVERCQVPAIGALPDAVEVVAGDGGAEGDRQVADALVDLLLASLEPEEADVVKKVSLWGWTFEDCVWLQEPGAVGRYRACHRRAMKKLKDAGKAVAVVS